MGINAPSSMVLYLYNYTCVDIYIVKHMYIYIYIKYIYIYIIISYIMGHLNCTAKFRPGRHLTSAKDLSFCLFCQQHLAGQHLLIEGQTQVVAISSSMSGQTTNL